MLLFNNCEVPIHYTTRERDKIVANHDCVSNFSPGVTIGDYTTIGAGSVVTKNLPARCVAVGNPVKILYMIDENRPPAKYAQTAMTLEEALKMNSGPGSGSPGA